MSRLIPPRNSSKKVEGFRPPPPRARKELAQDNLFVAPPTQAEKEWDGMPEMKQLNLAPYKTIYIHFENAENLKKFSELVGQPLTLETRSIWFPKAEIGRIANKRWVSGEFKSTHERKRYVNVPLSEEKEKDVTQYESCEELLK